jgi:catechol 2,3-dioxygenase-like lactoylglutathione lyase family enzyme
MAEISFIGHVGLYCNDVEKQKEFYTRVLGFKVTDPARDGTGYFMSAQPHAEHHQLLLLGGGKGDGKQLQQLSFHTDSLADVRDYYQRLKAAGARISRTITHGNAVSVYFYDPEDNLLEVYWDTGILCHQPFGHPVDLDGTDDAVMGQVQEYVAAHGRAWDPDAV